MDQNYMKIHIATHLRNSAQINDVTVRLVRRHVVPILSGWCKVNYNYQ